MIVTTWECENQELLKTNPDLKAIIDTQSQRRPLVHQNFYYIGTYRHDATEKKIDAANVHLYLLHYLLYFFCEMSSIL